jgi:hypothetical protein
MSLSLRPNGAGITSPAAVVSKTNGSFVFSGLSPTRNRLLVLADGFAPLVRTLDPKDMAKPIQIELSRGATISGTVIGPDDKPAAAASVTADEWNEAMPFMRRTTTDAAGHFQIDFVPTSGTFKLRPSMRGLAGVEITTTARAEPFMLSLVRFAKMKLAVLDDATGKPISKFRYGISMPSRDPTQFLFAPDLRQNVNSEAGTADVEVTSLIYESPKQAFRIRVAAEGYLSCDTPTFVAGTESQSTVRLARSKPLGGLVIDPSGTPAAKVQVAWVRDGRHVFVLANGMLGRNFLESAESVVESGADGRFEDLKPTTESGKIVAVGPAGFVVASSKDFASGGKLNLQSWSRVRGRLERQGKAMPNESITLRGDFADGVMIATMNARTDAAGQFQFDYVPPTHVKISGAHSLFAEADLKPGRTATVTVHRND